jgi:hypothetical protein
MRILLGLFLCLTFYSFTAESTIGSSDMDKNKLDELFAKIDPIEKFKHRVDFNQSVSREASNTRVDAHWEHFSFGPVAHGLKVAGPVVTLSTLAHDTEARFRWVLSNTAIVGTVYAVDAFTAAGARKLFMDNAEDISLPEIPYVKGPANLGTVAAISKDNSAGHKKLFWIYQNMYFEINAGSTVDQLALARSIQEHAEKNLQPVNK